MAKEEINKKKSRNLKFVKLYIIPIFAGLSFIGIIIFLIIPKVSEILGQLDTISTNNQIISDKNTELNNLQHLADTINSVNQNLDTVNKIAPTGTSEVVKFRDEITLIIKKNNLTVNSQKLNENSVDTKDSNNPQLAGNILLQELPFSFELTGGYNDIVNFINSLNSLPDFIVIKEMDLSLQQLVKSQVPNLSNSSQSSQSSALLITPTSKWSFKMNIVKYQFRITKDEVLNKVYLGVNSTIRISNNIITYLNFKQKEIQSNTSNPPPTLQVSGNPPR